VFLPDVNVLIYAFRADSTHHVRARSWLHNVVKGEGAFGISPLALSALVRITSNRTLPGTASTLDECFAFCDELTRQPNCRIVEPGPRHWIVFQRLCVETETVGPRVTDAWFAALAIEHGCEWVTLDRDFARFPGLKWRTPD
jgi:toxin-antitoxin system PIN domain toxin